DEAGTRRVYPEPAAFGLLGYYSPALYGSAELEAALDEELSGEGAGNPLSEWLDDLLHRERRGYDAELTIDLALQQQAIAMLGERKSTRLNSSHVKISYAVFCLKKKRLQWSL